MATHRRPPVSVMPPPELFVYNPADWVSLFRFKLSGRPVVRA